MRCVPSIKSLSFAICTMMPSASMAACTTVGAVVAITGSALRDLSNIKTAFNTVVVTPVTLQVDVAFSNIQNAISSRDMQVVEAIRESAISASISTMEAELIQQELMQTYEKALADDVANLDNQLINDDGIEDGPAEMHFRRMCAENKIKESSFSSKGYSARKEDRSIALAESDVASSVVTDERGAAIDIQTAHLENFCSEADVEVGLCGESSEVPYADLHSFIALTPMNIGNEEIDDDTGYITSYTYSDFEYKAAMAFYKNILQQGMLKRPTVTAARRDPSLMGRYNQLQAGLSLANYSFMTSVGNRVALNPDDAQPMSRLDGLGYLISRKEQEYQELSSTATQKGHVLELYNQIAMKNMIEHEKAQYQERINNITSALIAIKEGSPSRIEEIESLR
ncbi:exported hypothetical protein [Vibrio chagasii]|nr:exported hypothetical protein [Vibrio chagasii]